MTKRRFELPGIQDLSKEQEAAVRDLPAGEASAGSGGYGGSGGRDGSSRGHGHGDRRDGGRRLIVGGPGTGKTVVALLRARRHRRERDEYVFLVFNHLLHRFSDQLFPGELSGATWQRWFGERFEIFTGESLPRKPAEPGAFRPIDWDGVADGVARARPVADAPFLVIDEGQDMPPQFYRTLVELGFERFFVTADQNQQIGDEHSSRRDIETELALDARHVVELLHNHRNTGPVARLASAFYTGDPASPPVELPSRHGPAAWLCDYAPGRFADVCRRIVKRVGRDPRELIGVIAPNDDVRRRYVDGLRAAAAGLENDAPRIETFFGRHRPDVRFDEGGILVINVQACKGLEFDVAVLADIDRHHVRPTDLDAVRKRFYVMVARARERVILLRRRGVSSRIDEILPDDPAVLRRKDLL